MLSIGRRPQDDMTSMTWVNLVMQETQQVSQGGCAPFTIKDNPQRTISSHLAD